MPYKISWVKSLKFAEQNLKFYLKYSKILKEGSKKSRIDGTWHLSTKSVDNFVDKYIHIKKSSCFLWRFNGVLIF
jgi:hypothetical protein